MKICSICQQEYEGFGNNAQPINSGRCCDACNGLVVAARITQFYRRKEETKSNDAG